MYNNAMYKSFNCIRFHLYNLFIVVENLDLFAYNKIFVMIISRQLSFLKAQRLSEIEFFVYIKSCQYSMFYTNKMFWTKSQVLKIGYNVVISEKNLNA